MLRSVVRALDLTPMKLCRLIGRNADNSHHWFSRGQNPSKAYWVRISYLLVLAQQGVDLRRVRTINWARPPYEIEWWPEVKNARNCVPVKSQIARN